MLPTASARVLHSGHSVSGSALPPLLPGGEPSLPSGLLAPAGMQQVLPSRSLGLYRAVVDQPAVLAQLGLW